MKVVVRTLGRDASVADWPTNLFQAIIVSPSILGVDTVMVVSVRGGCPRAIDPIAERLLPLGRGSARGATLIGSGVSLPTFAKSRL